MLLDIVKRNKIINMVEILVQKMKNVILGINVEEVFVNMIEKVQKEFYAEMRMIVKVCIFVKEIILKMEK